MFPVKQPEASPTVRSGPLCRVRRTLAPTRTLGSLEERWRRRPRGRTPATRSLDSGHEPVSRRSRSSPGQDWHRSGWPATTLTPRSGPPWCAPHRPAATNARSAASIATLPLPGHRIVGRRPTSRPEDARTEAPAVIVLAVMPCGRPKTITAGWAGASAGDLEHARSSGAIALHLVASRPPGGDHHPERCPTGSGRSKPAVDLVASMGTPPPVRTAVESTGPANHPESIEE
jgi:hypothetical protein